MKQCILLCFLLPAICLSACERHVAPETPQTEQSPPTDTLFDEYIAYSKNNPDTVKILKEYGTYNECRVFSVRNQQNNNYQLQKYKVFECHYQLDGDRPVFVSKEGKIRPLDKAFQTEWLRWNDMFEIASQIDPLFSRREFQGSEPPQDKTKREEFFKQEYCNYLQFMYPDEDWYDEDVFVGSEIMSYDQWGIEVISMGPAQIPSEVQLGDYTIQCPEGEYLFVYDGKNFFCDIRYAFAEGLINNNDVYDIGWLYDPTFLERYPKEEGRIEPALRNRIRQDFNRQFFLEGNSAMDRFQDIDVGYYYGDFHGCELVFIYSPLCYTANYTPIKIAGYLLFFKGGTYIYKDHTFCTVPQAYDAGWLTKQDIRDIHELGFGVEE